MILWARTKNSWFTYSSTRLHFDHVVEPPQPRFENSPRGARTRNTEPGGYRWTHRQFLLLFWKCTQLLRVAGCEVHKAQKAYFGPCWTLLQMTEWRFSPFLLLSSRSFFFLHFSSGVSLNVSRRPREFFSRLSRRAGLTISTPASTSTTKSIVTCCWGWFKFEICHAYNSGQGTILRCYTNPANSTDRPPLLRMYLTTQTAVFADNVLSVMSLFLMDGGICG